MVVVVVLETMFTLRPFFSFFLLSHKKECNKLGGKTST